MHVGYFRCTIFSSKFTTFQNKSYVVQLDIKHCSKIHWKQIAIQEVILWMLFPWQRSSPVAGLIVCVCASVWYCEIKYLNYRNDPAVILIWGLTQLPTADVDWRHTAPPPLSATECWFILLILNISSIQIAPNLTLHFLGPLIIHKWLTYIQTLVELVSRCSLCCI